MPSQITPRNFRLARRANALRNTGATYSRIAKILSISSGKAWSLCNPERQRENSRESMARYIARGFVALCDMED